jgi:hypothetical protein
MTAQNIILELSAVIVGIHQGQPQVRISSGPTLPSGPLQIKHHTLEQALRAWVKTQIGIDIGYVEQLYTFADKDRTSGGKRVISIGYLALEGPETDKKNAEDWYSFFPWEDHRNGPPESLLNQIQQALAAWKKEAPDATTKRMRASRIAINFPKNLRQWNDELVLPRYEMLWEAGLVEESRQQKKATLTLGKPMKHDHRRILATAMARLRAKIKYRPVVFELLPTHFTLSELQETVEALAGLKIHKQNFRRLIMGQGLVEETGSQSQNLKGRPARLFAFRPEVLEERAAAGTKLARI